LADAYLGNAFGYSPMAADMARMIMFPLLVQQRLDELRRMNKNGGLSRKRTIVSGVVTGGSPNVPVHSLWVGIACRQTIITNYKMWGSVRWTLPQIPEFSGSPRDFEDMRRVMRAFSGLNGVGAIQTAWNLMPWTWLTDWFIDVDAYLGAHNHAIPAAASMTCVMSQTRTTETFTRLPGNNTITGGNASFTRVDKQRVASSPSAIPNVTLPIISARQTSILGALAIQRYRG